MIFIEKNCCIQRLFLLLFLCITVINNVSSENININGYVKDIEGNPIVGATIHLNNNKTSGTITNSDGYFELKAYKKDILEVSFIGYTTKKIKITSNNLNITLDESAQSINEIVVVGYGTTKKINLTGAIDQVGNEVFENRSVSNISQALQGAVPNLNISIADGKPSRTAVFNVRGTTSIGQGGNALILIDGVEGDPNMLNPNDIASVSVLKDAASAAIYGARGSFGVVLITTKNPSKGKTVINYTGNVSLQSPVATPDYVSDGLVYAEHFREAFYNYNQALPTAFNTIQPYSDEWLEEFRARKAAGNNKEVDVDSKGNYVYYGNTDWYDAIYKNNTIAQDHNVTISGGGEKADFYISGRFYKYDGLYNYNPDTYKSINVRAKSSLDVKKWLKISNNLEFSNNDLHNPIVINDGYNIQRYIELASYPSCAIFNPDGTITKAGAYTIGTFLDGNNFLDKNNKLFKNTIGFSTNFFSNRLHINGDFTIRYKVNENIRKRTPVNYSEKEDGEMSTYGSNLDIYKSNANSLYTATNLYFDFDNKFNGGHYLKIMGGYNYETSEYKSNSTARNGILLKDATSLDLALGDAITLSESISNWRILGLFFRFNYSFKDRYLMEINGRYDGSSKFPTNQQYAFFPSFSGGWRISEEPFWKINKNILSDVKIRASYGSLGNGNVAPYSFMELLNIYTSDRVLDQKKQNYTKNPIVIPNSLTWETATTSDIGVDLSFLNGHLHFTGDYYIRKTKDMYTVGATLPDVFGATSPKGNYADMTTKGWEISINYRNKFMLSEKPFNYEIKASLHDYISKIDKYNNLTNSLSDYYEGMTIGELWGYKTDGLFQSDAETEKYVNTIMKASKDSKWYAGDLKIVDINENGKIDYGSNTLNDPGDKIIIGNTEPRYIYSFNLKADWNNFFISAFFQGVGKQDWMPGKESSFWGQYNRPYNNVPKWHLNNYWTQDNPNAYLPRYSTYNTTLGWGDFATDRYLQNIAYIRLKNLQIGYNLPHKWINNAGLSDLRIYITGENLWCYSPLYKRTKDFDVSNASAHTDSDLGSNNQGDGNSYPLMRSFTFGLSLTF